MRKFIYLIVFLFSSHNIAAQKGNTKTIDSLTRISYKHIYTNKDSAYFYLDQATKLIDSSTWKSGARLYVAWNRSASYFYDLNRMEKNLRIIDSIYFEHKNELENSKDEPLYKSSLLLEKGVYNFEIDNRMAAKTYFDETLNTIEKIPDSLLNRYHYELLISAYGHTAKMYYNEFKYELAKQYYNKNIRLIKTKMPNDESRLNRYYSLLAEVYKSEGDFAKSNKFFIKSLNYNINKENRLNAFATETFHVVGNYVKLEKLDSAQYYLELMKSNIPEHHAMINRYHEAQADFFLKNNQYNQALKEYNMALKVLKERANGADLERIANLYNSIGELHAAFNEPQKAIANFNLGIVQLSKKNANKSALLKLLKNKAIVISAYDVDNSSEDIVATVEFGIETLDSLKPTFKSEADKLLLIEHAFPLFESGLESVYTKYQSTKDEQLIDRAFFYAEKSKSILLLEALLSAKATSFGTIPANLVEREKQLKAEILYLEKEINKGKKSLTNLEERLFDTKNDYRNLISTIETDYKDYYNLKYNTKVVSLSDAQNSLAKDEMLISYFYGDKYIYAISVSNSNKHFYRIENNSDLETNIREVYKMLSDPKSDLKALNSKTHQLYESILRPALKPVHKTKLIILADGLLNYIPYGSLNTNDESKSYVIEQNSVAYVNSASLWMQLKQNDVYDNSVLAFAPSFEQIESSEIELLPLPHNNREVLQILKSFDGNSYLNEEASLLKFKTELADYGIVHLATHAVFNDENPEFSYLAFTPNGTEENLLYVSDLYNLNLQSNLVTLSACNTGIGDLKRGEGFMSLTRGFFYSGASSIASTLWKVNDASSTQLMDGFYKNLAKGKSKDLAMQNAKLDFLKTNKQNDLSHPYYWSGFVVSGNTIAVKSSNVWVWVGLGILFLILSGFYLLRYKK